MHTLLFVSISAAQGDYFPVALEAHPALGEKEQKEMQVRVKALAHNLKYSCAPLFFAPAPIKKTSWITHFRSQLEHHSAHSCLGRDMQ